MGKAIVFSVLVATVVIPLWYARERRSDRGLHKATVAFWTFCVVWALATLYVAPRL